MTHILRFVRPTGGHRAARDWTATLTAVGLLAAGAVAGLIFGAFLGVTS